MIPIPKVPTNKNESSKSKTPLTSRSLTTKSPRSARSNFSTGSNAIHQSTPKSIRISTKSYDIFIHEKTNSKEALPEDLIETAEMTRMLVKFLKESKFQVILEQSLYLVGIIIFSIFLLCQNTNLN